MTWRDYSLARQYLVEERIGTRVRQTKQEEDVGFLTSKAALEKQRK
jgi:hypothetical protein